MSLLIKGMRMPKNCLECEWYEYYGGDYDWCHACRKTGTMPIENAETQRADDCPLVALPEKHGRLIDADAFAEFIEDAIKRQHYEDVAIDENLTVADVLTAVSDDLKGNTRVKYESNPTVIEAEGEE